MPVEELLTRFDSRQLAEMEAYFQLDPFGEDRADLRAAMIVAAIYNVNRKEGSTPFNPEDLMPRFGEDPAEGRQTPEEMRAVIEGLALMMESKRGKHRNNRDQDQGLRGRVS